MADVPNLEKRLNELEAHVAEQDNVIEELSDVLAKQWAEITDLNAKIEYLKSKTREAEDGTDSDAGSEAPPPHY
jgi:SlyX protein